jgi:hypothetical protein
VRRNRAHAQRTASSSTGRTIRMMQIDPERLQEPFLSCSGEDVAGVLDLKIVETRVASCCVPDDTPNHRLGDKIHAP